MREKQTILNNSFKEFKMHICLVTKVIEEFEEKYEGIFFFFILWYLPLQWMKA